MANLPELIVHIGAGKTGSTAIQFTLREEAAALKRQGVGYLGLMLEDVPGARRHDWCVPGAPQNFFNAAEPQRTDREVLAVLRRALARGADQGLTRLIWSNEAFLVQNARVIEILKGLAEDGVRIRPVAYVRRHDKRAASAYLEFGIKSKRYEGPLRPFRTWIRNHSIAYAGNLTVWQAAFANLEIYNFDAIDDVAVQFCTEVAGLTGVAPVRANETPSNALLAAWTVFSGSRPGTTWAAGFRRLAAPLKLLQGRSETVPPLPELVPDAAALRDVQETFRPDMERVNALLAARGQPPLVFDPPEARAHAPTHWETQRLLFGAVFALQEQVLDLKAEIAALKGAGPEKPKPKPAARQAP